MTDVVKPPKEGRTKSNRHVEMKIKNRRMHSRQDELYVSVVDSLAPGKITNGCCVCCHAPSCCAICSLCLCCDDSEFISLKREASKYIFIRENSIEWNDPAVTCTTGSCCGVDPCLFDIQDRVKVVYFDDPMLHRLTNTTRSCNECRTCLCGGRGERIQISTPCCCGLAYRAACPCVCMCVPICCPTALFPCTMRHEIYIEDANQGIYALREAIRAAQDNPLYEDTYKLQASPMLPPEKVEMNRA